MSGLFIHDFKVSISFCVCIYISHTHIYMKDWSVILHKNFLVIWFIAFSQSMGFFIIIICIIIRRFGGKKIIITNLFHSSVWNVSHIRIIYIRMRTYVYGHFMKFNELLTSTGSHVNLCLCNYVYLYNVYMLWIWLWQKIIFFFVQFPMHAHSLIYHLTIDSLSLSLSI